MNLTNLKDFFLAFLLQSQFLKWQPSCPSSDSHKADYFVVLLTVIIIKPKDYEP